jgi:hypothetical protein
VPILEELASDEDSVVAESAQWAVEQLSSSAARKLEL